MCDKIRKRQLNEVPSHVKMVMESIKSLANDCRYSVDEVERIVLIALEDGVVTEDETRVLASVLKKAQNVPLDDEVAPYIRSLMKLYL